MYLLLYIHENVVTVYVYSFITIRLITREQ